MLRQFVLSTAHRELMPRIGKIRYLFVVFPTPVMFLDISFVYLLRVMHTVPLGRDTFPLLPVVSVWCVVKSWGREMSFFGPKLRLVLKQGPVVSHSTEVH